MSSELLTNEELIMSEKLQKQFEDETGFAAIIGNARGKDLYHTRYTKWLEAKAGQHETLVMCTNCGNEDIKDERIDLEVHDGNFWRIEVKWCPDCKELLSLNEY